MGVTFHFSVLQRTWRLQRIPGNWAGGIFKRYGVFRNVKVAISPLPGVRVLEDP